MEKHSVDVVLAGYAASSGAHRQPACRILSESLKPGGRLIVSEENGNNPFIRAKNFATRGFNRVGQTMMKDWIKAYPLGMKTPEVSGPGKKI